MEYISRFLHPPRASDFADRSNVVIMQARRMTEELHKLAKQRDPYTGDIDPLKNLVDAMRDTQNRRDRLHQ